MLKVLFLFILVSGAFAQKLSLDERRTKILAIVDEELSEVTRLAKTQDYRNPDTLLRMAELNLEKARLFREAENEKFLSIPPDERRNINRASYFQKSSEYFQSANNAALMVVKRFPKYKGMGEVYYILAYNNKELNNHDQAQKYFSQATKTSPDKSKVLYKSRLALAEYYYNDHRYKEAIPLYESALNLVDDKWWTKDSFNLAWSYYRTKQYDKAISLMKKVHQRSGDSKYVDMRSQVERDIGIFYVDATKMSEAIAFYNSINVNYTTQFIKIANMIISQGRFAQAESLLEQAVKVEQDRDRKIQIYVTQLGLYDKYNKIADHLKVSSALVKLHQETPLDEDSLRVLTFQVNKKAAELQKATASELYANVPKVKQEKSRQSIAYFDLAAQLNPNVKAEKFFFSGETAFAATNFGKALGLYVKAFDAAKAQNDKKIMTQSLEGMLSALGQPGLASETADKFYEPVYGRYITVDTKSERAKSIFVKLFNAQFDNGKVPEAEGTLEKFAAAHPEDYKTQEGMLAKIMEHHRKRKDYAKVKSFVGDINGGKYKVSAKYAEALRSLMTKIQIEGVQQSLEKGDKAVALKGYQQIYENPESTPKAKTNAAYNLSALYFEAGEMNQSYQWGVVALKEMDPQDVNKFADSFLSISAGLFLKQHFQQSSDLSHRVLAKLCKQNSPNKAVAYKNAVFIGLANGDVDKAIEIRGFGKECGVPDTAIGEVSVEILKDLARERRWEAYQAIVTELEATPSNHPLLIAPLEPLRLQNLAINDTNEASTIGQKQARYYEAARAKKVDVPVEALDLMADRVLDRVREKNQRVSQIELKFPEADFNNAVKAKLKILDDLTNDVNTIQKIGSGKGIVEAYKIVIDAYEAFGNSLKNFSPEGKSPEYVTSFRKAMSEVYDPILANARKQRGEIRKLVTENKILSDANYAVLYGEESANKRYLTIKQAVLMDRGGKQ